MKKTALFLLIYYAVLLLIIIAFWVKEIYFTSSSGVNDGMSGLGKSIASVIFAVCCLVVLIGGICSYVLYRNPQSATKTQLIILFIVPVISAFLVLNRLRMNL